MKQIIEESDAVRRHCISTSRMDGQGHSIEARPAVRTDMAMASDAEFVASSALTVETVTWVRHWNEHLFSFAITRPPTFRFRSAEFVMIGLPQNDGRPLLRAYSIASPAYHDELEFLSIKVPDGPLTSHLQSICVSDRIYLGGKPTGTLVTDALRSGSRLFMLATGTGLAPFLSLARDPDVYEMFAEVIIAHSVRRVADLALGSELEGRLGDDLLVSEQAIGQFHYVPTVTREDFYIGGRLDAAVASGTLFAGSSGPPQFDPRHDRITMSGSTPIIRNFASMLEAAGFVEGSNAKPRSYVIERVFVA